MNLSIVIPCYNEAANIPLILKQFNNKISNDSIELVLVNNGSTDNSKLVLNALVDKYEFVRIVNIEINQGYGYGILTGLKTCKSDYIGWTHADMQTDPNDIIRAYDIIKSKEFPKNIYVKGLRKGRSIFDLIFTWSMSLFESIYFKQKLWDINAQPNIFHKSLLEKWGNPPHDFSIDLFALYKANKLNFKIFRFSVLFAERIHGQSKWNSGIKSKIKFICRTLKFSINLKKDNIK